jgi:Caspase domain
MDRYDDPEISQLNAPRQDAEALARALAHAEIGGFEVTSRINAEAHVVRREIEAFFSERERDDTLLLYFSGHGMKDSEGQLHFIASDTRRKLLQSTGVAAAFVNEVMRRSRSRQQILIIDSCYSGAFARGMLVRSDNQVHVGEAFSHGKGRAVITASDAMQYAFEGDEVKGSSAGSVFTRNLIRGLESGEADQDNDGWVSFDEMYDYLYDRVTVELPEQVPRKWVFDVEGDIIIARNANPRAADLPPELKDALADSRVFVREGAVRELGTFLQSDRPGLVKAARLALQRIGQEDDSRSVSSMAAKLLGEHEVAAQKPAPAGEQAPEPAEDLPALPQAEAPDPASRPKPEVARAPRHEPKAAARVVEKPPGNGKPLGISLGMSNAQLVAIHALVWALVGSGEVACIWMERNGHFPAPLETVAIGAFCGLCSGWVSGLVAKRLASNLPDRAAMRIALGWATTIAVLFGLTWSWWYWTDSPFLDALGFGVFGLLGGLNVAFALMPARSPDANRRWLVLYAAGWAAAFYLGHATYFYLMGMLGWMSSAALGWLLIAIFGTLCHVTMLGQLNKGRMPPSAAI